MRATIGIGNLLMNKAADCESPTRLCILDVYRSPRSGAAPVHLTTFNNVKKRFFVSFGRYNPKPLTQACHGAPPHHTSPAEDAIEASISFYSVTFPPTANAAATVVTQLSADSTHC